MLPAVGNARKNVGFSQLPHDLWQRHAVCGVATNRVAIEKFANLIHHTNPGETVPGQSSRFSKSCPVHTGHKQENKRYYFHAERKGREAKQKQGAERWRQ
jgi:hypothetical protein